MKLAYLSYMQYLHTREFLGEQCTHVNTEANVNNPYVLFCEQVRFKYIEMFYYVLVLRALLIFRAF